LPILIEKEPRLMEIGFIVLVGAVIPGIVYFFLPRHLKRRIQLEVHHFVLGFGDRIQNFNKDWQTGALDRELIDRVRDRETAKRLLVASRISNPDKPKKWHLEKIIYDLKRGR
jgi:hypothetical protein